MKTNAAALRSYLQACPWDTGDDDCATILALLHPVRVSSHEPAPSEIQAGFAELETFLESLPLVDNNAVLNLTCRLCTRYEHRAFLDSLRYSSILMMEATTK